MLYPRLNFSQPLNAEEGDMVGVEAQLAQQFTFLPACSGGRMCAASDQKAVRTSGAPG